MDVILILFARTSESCLLMVGKNIFSAYFGEAWLRSSVRDLSPAGEGGLISHGRCGGVQRFLPLSLPLPRPSLPPPTGKAFSFPVSEVDSCSHVSTAALIQTVSSYQFLSYVQPRLRFMSAIFHFMVKSNCPKGKTKKGTNRIFVCWKLICSIGRLPRAARDVVYN